MAILLSLVVSFLLLRFTFTLASPHYRDISLKDRTISGCNFPVTSSVSCSNGIVSFNTGSGTIRGTLTSQGAIRFVVKYATAQRFQQPQIAQVSAQYVGYDSMVKPF